ncbi:hypothetical protein J4234_06255 [Candidatus Woesearchaeota archaeon]|nr:hypothetical protein [Candidatus Woesearchaeota archaeon]
MSIIAKNPRSQAAMEFLSSYTFAIMAVLLALSVLIYFGMFGSKMLPKRCIIQPGIACLDFLASRDPLTGIGDIQIALENQFPYDIRTVNVTASGCIISAVAQNIIANDVRVFTTRGCSFPAKSYYSGQVNVTYLNLKSGIKHIAFGTLDAPIYDQILTSTSPTACRNANDAGLCDGLDVVYGIGYKLACCTEYTLCC